jgi:hypothetical protein
MKFGQCLVQQFLLILRRTGATQQIRLLQLAQPLEDLRSLFRLEPGQLVKNLGLAHGGILSAGTRRGQ